MSTELHGEGGGAFVSIIGSQQALTLRLVSGSEEPGLLSVPESSISRPDTV